MKTKQTWDRLISQKVHQIQKRPDVVKFQNKGFDIKWTVHIINKELFSYDSRDMNCFSNFSLLILAQRMSNKCLAILMALSFYFQIALGWMILDLLGEDDTVMFR